MSFKYPDLEIFDYYPRLGKVQSHVTENLFEDISLEQAAKIAAMEMTYFSSYFKDRVGISFTEWMRRLRTKRAMELLAETDHSITHIAFEVGFNDLRTFERNFKKLTGKTPTDFRAELDLGT